MIVARIRDETDPEGENIEWIRECATYAGTLKRDLATLSAIGTNAENALTEILSFDGDRARITTSGLRTLAIEVSQGMLNQHLLTLTDAKRSGLVKGGEKFKIQLPDGTIFSTELCDPGNKLRERGLIRKFYADSNVTEGDTVVMEEKSRGSWLLRRAHSGDQAAEDGELNKLLQELSDDKSDKL